MLSTGLSISTFIENACIHGIETTEKEGVISLTITKDNEYLLVEYLITSRCQS